MAGPWWTKRAGMAGLWRRRPARRLPVVTMLLAAGALMGSAAFFCARAEPVLLEVSQAVAGTDEISGKPTVSFVLTAAGREVFARFTEANVGKRVFIRVDGATLGKPIVAERVAGGVGQIPVASPEAAETLARRLADQGARLEVETASD